MKIKLDALHLTILAALGLELACAVRPGGSDDEPTSSGDGDTGEVHDCVDPEPIMQAGTSLPSGFVRCEDGFIHRAEAVECEDPQGPDDELCAMDEFGGCQSAADCVDQDHGRCLTDDISGCYCSYGCATDADCIDGFICACAGVVSENAVCIPGDCVDDAACGEGLCGLSAYNDCCGTSYQTACASPDEACHVDAECGEGSCDPNDPAGEGVVYECAVQGDGEPGSGWTCKPPGWCNCACGRPFFVDGNARVAPVSARADWASSVSVVPVDAHTRAQLVAYWTDIGQCEHAAVASFARFGLQLMQLGAPPRLLRQNRQALVEEIEHARLAFGLASAYAGAPIGPGGFDVSAAFEGLLDAPSIVEGLIVEACVGETLSAIEAREAAAQAEDPAVAAILEQIADDEWRHAQLGWRSLGWMLETGDAELRRFALTTLEHATRAVASRPRERGVPISLRPHGVLDDALRDEILRAGLERVILPCVAALRERAGQSLPTRAVA